MLVQLEFNGSPYLGVFARANDSVAIVPASLQEGTRKQLEEALETRVVPMTLGGSNILGAICAMNNKGAVVAEFADEGELELLRALGIKVARIAGKFNAAGNNILANDHGALVNPDLGKRAIDAIASTLDVKVEVGTIAGLKTVGSAACATSRGVLCHPKTKQDELERLEELLDVDANIGTVNHGAPYIGAGLVANAKGCAIGTATTGPEMNRIEDALGYI